MGADDRGAERVGWFVMDRLAGLKKDHAMGVSSIQCKRRADASYRCRHGAHDILPVPWGSTSGPWATAHCAPAFAAVRRRFASQSCRKRVKDYGTDKGPS